MPRCSAASTRAKQEALRDFGLHFGLAYQLVDDWLDYAGAADAMGKNVGDDLAEGKLTLPLIHALARGNATQTRTLREAIAAKSHAALPAVLSIVRQTGALDYTQALAQRQSEKAVRCLAALPDNEFKEALDTLARFAVARLN